MLHVAKAPKPVLAKGMASVVKKVAKVVYKSSDITPWCQVHYALPVFVAAVAGNLVRQAGMAILLYDEALALQL